MAATRPKAAVALAYSSAWPCCCGGAAARGGAREHPHPPGARPVRRDGDAAVVQRQRVLPQLREGRWRDPRPARAFRRVIRRTVRVPRGSRLREVLKQPQNSPLSIAEQVGLIYTGINGHLDELPLTSVKKYCSSLLDYLKTNKLKYSEIIASTLQFTEEAETLLKEAITESKEKFKATL